MRHTLTIGRNPLAKAPKAAQAIAENRASKIDLLLADRIDQCTEIARTNADSLIHDVCEYIADGEIPAREARTLANIAIRVRNRCYA